MRTQRPLLLVLGVGPEAEVEAYLEGVAHDRVIRFDADEVTTVTEPGRSAPAAPDGGVAWQATAEGAGTQTLTFDAAAGDWIVVVMNADLTPGVAVDASGGVSTDLLLPVGLGLLATALVLVGIAAVLLVAGAGTATTTPDGGVDPTGPVGPATTASPPANAPVPHRGTPVQLTGTLDPDLSRGTWLVKWFLALPHLVVLALLWAAFVVLTLVAGVAILLTKRYPRAIFDVNVGVLRWTWRVTYYAFGVLGTDAYPPFTLAHDPDYPASLRVTPPGELSRGLVLVKWWLLALPHYVVLAVITGGTLAWTFDVGADEGLRVVASTGLVGVLVLVAAVTLLFTGRYPQALFDLVMGLQRWTYRVAAYAALMTDDYPPFRLDPGGEEPPVGGPVPPDAPGGGNQHRELTHR